MGRTPDAAPDGIHHPACTASSGTSSTVGCSMARNIGTAEPEQIDTVIIGAGQAGLSVGYHLAQRGREIVILDSNARVGDSWRTRWASLRLFSPARFDGLD